MTDQAKDERDVLRSIWDTEAHRLDLDEDCSPTKVCRNMKDVSFDGLAEPGTDLGDAWRDRLAREGKIAQASGSVRDIVFGPVDDQPG